MTFRCMLPLWTLFGEVQLHDSKCGASCSNILKDVGKLVFGVMRDQKASFTLLDKFPGTLQEDWEWLFKSRVPGILQMYNALETKWSSKQGGGTAKK